jgi:Ca2+-binding RTX toxin-like protein
MAVFMALVISMSNVGIPTSQAAINPINLSPVGNGFTVTAADLEHILRQIKIAEQHVANTTATTGLCGALIGNGPNQIPSPLVSDGLRTVDGSCNNLQVTQEKYGAADQVFPRLATAVFKSAEDSNVPGIGPVGPPGLTSYAQSNGMVVDSQPRMISNLIVDQTSTNPAAVWVAANPARAQADPFTAVPCITEPSAPGAGDGVPLGCTPAHETLFIPNITTDVGLSPPFNSLFTIFGQFFDHGLDKVTNGGNGAVMVPLRDDDPLVAGDDHILGNADDLPADKRFIPLTRGTIVNHLPGPDGQLGTSDDLRETLNTDTPFVDQSQTYTSHSSHQVFLREYKVVSGKPVATGKFLSTADGGMATWAMIKEQAATKLGLQLVDVDVNNIPMVLADLYGNFIPGPNGLPQYVTAADTTVEGNLITPVTAESANAKRIETAFLNDIAHSAGPGNIGSAKTPDADLTAGGSLDPVASGEYDNELLDLHYICGDGRCNENIGLTAIHQVFHMEHDRLVDYFFNDNGSNIPSSFSGVLAENPTLLAAYQAVQLDPAQAGKTFTFEERLFQAARFVTEMQYQHLVFEEFARKVQPAVNAFPLFAFNQTDLNPAISAEFAHAVYRFGHSMLTEKLPRKAENGTDLGIDLLKGFLNPNEFNNPTDKLGSPIGPRLSDKEAVGSLIMGLSDETGNEIDEFVTETLRNHLLGLPLDLATINITRARSEGIPSLNNVRKQIFAATNDGQMTPYASWVAFGEEIKHPMSLVNFIAAYGKHPNIMAAATLTDKRVVAQQLINGDPSIPDSAEFMFSTGAWASAGDGVSLTGVDDIDLWMGGLAEKTNLFGGLLGTTFNYVFEKQLTDLQNGDRFYYLARTPGMNLRAQLEGNSFAELVLRNTHETVGAVEHQYAHTLKADSFATADCKFELGNLTSPATPGLPGNDILGAGSVNDDPTTDCNENHLLVRLPGKTAAGIFKYRAVNLDNPEGINGQAVYNGTDLADEFFGGNDNDTFWGGLGNDIIQGGGGDDVMLGGEGDDIMSDQSGFDVMKGGPGNDAMDGGIGDDVMTGGDGKDFINGGGNNNAIFAGPGDDFVTGGSGIDEIIADSGDDWLQGNDLADLLIGDSSALFFDDRNLPGNDIFIGQGGDDDYDMEGGDDIGVGGPGVEKVAGAAGFDWQIGLGDPQPQDADLARLIVEAPTANEVRDRYNEVEALSGWDHNDKLRGDSIVPSLVGGGGFIGCDSLDQDGLDRISGLDDLVPPLTTPAPVAPAFVTNYCQLVGNVWGDGNILLGGAGDDVLEGRGGNDILDGDRYLSVRLSIRADVDANGEATGVEIGSTNLMEGKAVTGTFGDGTNGMTLQQAVFAGLVNPGQIVAVREIITPANGGNDTAVFTGARASYVIAEGATILNPAVNGDGSFTISANNPVTVNDTTVAGGGGGRTDGVDTLRNIETLVFCGDFVDPILPHPACPPPAVDTVRPATVNLSVGSLGFGNLAINTTSPVQGITLSNPGNAVVNVTRISVVGAGAASFVVPTNCEGPIAPNGSCTISVRFAPTSAGAKVASISIVHDGSTATPPIPVSGTGTGGTTGGGTGTTGGAVTVAPRVAVAPVAAPSVTAPSAPASIADSFNRADTNSLGSNWKQMTVQGQVALQVSANRATTAANSSGSAYFKTAGGSAQAAGFTFANAPVNNSGLYLKATGPIGVQSRQMRNAVRVLYNNGSVAISITTNGNTASPNYTTVGSATTGGALVRGNSLLAAVDSTGKVWVWKVVGNTSILLTPSGVQLPNNALWTTGGGKVGMRLPNGAKVDDFVR